MFIMKTRMHSSRMRTVRCSSRLLGRGVSAQGGVCLGVSTCQGRGVSACQEGCLPAGVGVSAQEGISACQGVYTSPLCGQTDTSENNLSATTVATDNDCILLNVFECLRSSNVHSKVHMKRLRLRFVDHN